MQGLDLHIDDIVKLADKYPDTTFMLDHFGFCKVLFCGLLFFFLVLVLVLVFLHCYRHHQRALLVNTAPGRASKPQLERSVIAGPVPEMLHQAQRTLQKHRRAVSVQADMGGLGASSHISPCFCCCCCYCLYHSLFPSCLSLQMVRILCETFGAQRLMWGTDFPYIEEKCTYSEAWDVLDQIQKEGGTLYRSRSPKPLAVATFQTTRECLYHSRDCSSFFLSFLPSFFLGGGSDYGGAKGMDRVANCGAALRLEEHATGGRAGALVAAPARQTELAL